MFVVAVAELSGDLEPEAAALAPAIGLAPLDVRVRLGGILPRVLFQSISEADASRVLAATQALGHGAFLFDSREVTPSAQLVRLHRFAFEEKALLANDGGPRLAYEDLGAIIVATSRLNVARTTSETELMERANVRPAPTTRVDVTRHEHTTEHATYLFPRTLLTRPEEPPPRPWLFHEREAQFVSLGPLMRATRHDNYLATLELIRARAPNAIYDDRFNGMRPTGSQLVHVRGHDAAVGQLSDAANDLAVHLLARWLLRDRAGPYR